MSSRWLADGLLISIPVYADGLRLALLARMEGLYGWFEQPLKWCLFLFAFFLSESSSLLWSELLANGVERIVRLSGHSGFLILPFNHSVQRLDWFVYQPRTQASRQSIPGGILSGGDIILGKLVVRWEYTRIQNGSDSRFRGWIGKRNCNRHIIVNGRGTCCHLAKNKAEPVNWIISNWFWGAVANRDGVEGLMAEGLLADSRQKKTDYLS